MIALILKEPDLGTALVCAGVMMFMLYLAGMQMRYIGIAGLCASPVMVLHAVVRAVAAGADAKTVYESGGSIRWGRDFTSCSR